MIDLRLGDCIEVMRELPDNSVDSIITDPPYHLTSTDGGKTGFMGKEWDGGDIAFRTEVWTEALRVLKPGGHLLAFGGSRTYHRLATAIENSGFEIRDQILWIYGSGFPKSHNIGKAIDKTDNPEKWTNNNYGGGNYKCPNCDKWIMSGNPCKCPREVKEINNEWSGWGTALKPAHEPIVMARKPLSEKTIVDNVLEWGTGGINIDESRIPYNSSEVSKIDFDRPRVRASVNEEWILKQAHDYTDPNYTEYNQDGRFPANVLLSEEAAENLDEHTGILKGDSPNRKPRVGGHRDQYVGTDSNEIRTPVVSDKKFGDGGASKFFYVAKPSKKEKNEGLEDFEEKQVFSEYDNGYKATTNGTSDKLYERNTKRKNTHPTIKPVKLMEYLCKLITRKEGVILDMFMGSGTTGIAAIKNGYSFIGIEREPEYMEISKARLEYENNKIR